MEDRKEIEESTCAMKTQVSRYILLFSSPLFVPQMSPLLFICGGNERLQPESRLQSQIFACATLSEPAAVNACFACLSPLAFSPTLFLLCAT